MSWIVGVDVGGTFTDFHALHQATGRYAVHKTPSSPANPARAIIQGLRELCDGTAVPREAIGRLAHGTTVATNALLQRRGGRVALITTKGFRDLLEIGRQIRPHMFNMQIDQPEALVPRELRFEVAERLLSDGSCLVGLDDSDIDAIVRQVAAADVEACAVCLLFSYVNGEHERRIGAALARALPRLDVSLSSAVQPEFREYERFSTAVLNAYLQPVMGHYLGAIVTELSGEIPKAAIGINQSIGGLMSAERAKRYPVRTALSGPAAGVMGAIHMAHLSNRPNIITLDMGGTSADVALVRDFHADTAFDRSVGGFPVRLPMVDIHTIGAGGGSIAWFERDGMMKVGPISAGAVPGPACYGNGGERPTVTDANLVLGRLSPKGLLDGRIPLDATAARRVMKPLAEQMGCTVERAARGVVEIVVSNMVRAIRAISVERGHDPRQFTLFPFGGAGPLHATDVAESLDIREILVPLSPGILCAHGLLVSDLKENFVRSVRVTLEDGQAGAVAAPLKSLQADAEAWFAVEAIPAADRVVEIVLDMRHVGQNFELAVPIAGAPDVAMLRRLFLEAHERNYGYANPLDPVEIVNFRLTARGRFKTPEPLPAPKTVAPLPKPSSRAVCFRDDRAQPTPVYQRAELSAGQEIVGPAVVDQLDSTSLVYPGYRLRVDAALNFIVTRDAA